MRHLFLVLLLGAAACESAPTAPTVIPAPSVPPVATSQPLVWDSRDELSAWVTNGVSAGDAAIAGDGIDAVIQIDVRQRNATLHGPDLDPALASVRTVRMRYRWVDRDAADSALTLSVYLREPGDTLPETIPRLFPPIGSANPAEFHSGSWIERTFTSVTNSIRPPFLVRFALVGIGTLSAGSPRRYHGYIEIDWIALTEDPVR